jgi:NADH dehydrogenase [ubiquinone] 1 alpha subcomplex assembly factor 5
MEIEVFSRVRRRTARARALKAPIADAWLFRRNADDLIDRLTFVNRPFDTALLIGDRANYVGSRLSCRAITRCSLTLPADVVADEDALPFADDSFDLVIAPHGLESVSDLPGALILIRRILKPGGLFLAAMAGAGSLPRLRDALTKNASRENRAAVARLHPQIEVRSAGDLLMRAGFSLPVADIEVSRRVYPTLFDLVHDIRRNDLSNCLPVIVPFSRSEARALAEDYQECSAQGTLAEAFLTLFLVGWAPELSEERPKGPIKAWPIGLE